MKRHLKKLLMAATVAWLPLPGLSADVTADGGLSKAAVFYEDAYKGLPFEMEKVNQPVFPQRKVSIVDFGAKGDGVAVNTTAINEAIKTVSQQGGGTVVVPQGLWMTGPIQLLDNVNLYMERNALVVFVDDFKAYPIVETNFEGLDTRRCQALLFAENAKNIAITGYGVFDGQGDRWRPVKKSKMTDSQWQTLLASGGVLSEDGSVWYPDSSSLKGAMASPSFNTPMGLTTDAEWEAVRTWLRPEMLRFTGCKKVLLQGVIFRNSPCWTLHPFLCEDVTIDGVQVSNPWYAQNGDALDLDCCNRALIINNVFDAGDDGICIKSGKDEDGRRRGVPCQNVIARNNVVLHGHGGFVVGSEMSGGVKNMFVSDCTFLGTDIGLRFKSNRGRGGVVENIFIDNINMIDIPNEALIFNLYYQGKDPGMNVASDDAKEPVYKVTEETPAFRNIHISNIHARNVGTAIRFNGLPEMPVRNVTVKNAVIDNANHGVLINYAENVSLDNLKVNTKGQTLEVKNTKELIVNGQKHEPIGKIGKNIDL